MDFNLVCSIASEQFIAQGVKECHFPTHPIVVVSYSGNNHILLLININELVSDTKRIERKVIGIVIAILMVPAIMITFVLDSLF